MNPGTIRSCYMYSDQRIQVQVVLHVHQRSVIIGDESRYNKVVLHVHQRQSVVIGDK